MIEGILRRRVTTIVATVALSALGAFSLARLPLSLLPAVERPRLVITARTQAVSRDEILSQVTEPLERRLALVPGLASIESETTDGEAKITLEAAWQTDADRMRIDVAQRIEGATALPLDELRVDTSATDLAPVIDVAITGANGPTRTTVAQRVVLPELARIDGAGSIETIGASPLRVVVEPRLADLVARGLTAADIEQRLQGVGRPIAAGRARQGAAVRPVAIVESIRTPDDLARLRVGGVPLGDLATVALREIPEDSSFRSSDAADGWRATEGVLLRVSRAPNANAVALARAVRQRVDELSRRTGNVRLRIISDRSREVSRALMELALSALLGIALGTLVLRFALGRWRPTVALSIVIPVALLVSFTVFYFAGLSLDVISLAGLALATGLLVDNSIVVLESIETARAAGDADAIAAGTRRIVTAVVASSFTLMVVFAPLLYLRGLARAIFGEQALAVVASVGASLLLSLTLTPVLEMLGARRGRASGGGLPADAPHRTFGRDAYLRALDRAFDHRRGLLLAVAVVVAAGLAIAAFLPRELFARGESSHIVADIVLPAELDVAASRATSAALWQRSTAAVKGRGAAAMWLIQSAGEAQADVALQRNNTAPAVMQSLREAFSVPGVVARVRPRPSAFIEGVAGNADRVEVMVSATTQRDADDLAARVDAAMSRAGFERRADESTRGTNAVALRWDDQRLAMNGIDRATVERQLHAALGNLDAGVCDVRGAETAIRLLPVSAPSLADLPLRVSAGRIVPVAAIASVGLTRRAPLVRHDQGRPAQRLLFENSGRDPAAVLSGIALGRGERVRAAGHQRELHDAFTQMWIVFILAAFLLYLTVAAFYESLLLPLLVMAAIPFAAAGAVIALFLTGQSLNLMSLIGLALLGGIVVNHTVVLLDRAEQLRHAGASEAEAIRAAATDRYRPVLMTTATAILGMLPLAVIGGEGVELRRAIAVAVIGGLVTATAGTLLIVPLLHAAVEPWRRRAKAARPVPSFAEPARV